jgi:hypothetical protein
MKELASSIDYLIGSARKVLAWMDPVRLLMPYDLRFTAANRIIEADSDRVAAAIQISLHRSQRVVNARRCSC